VAILRSPDGCPWDREQTHRSLRANLLEEAAEAAEAIDEGDAEHLCEELGDVLLQVVMHAELAQESGAFTFGDVVDGIAQKLIRRHPHVFGDVRAEDKEQALKTWNEVKRAERERKSR
jgi:tetrapyrrole methylase family protein/MazG family protein